MTRDFYPHPAFPLDGQFHQRGAVWNPEWFEMVKAGYQLQSHLVCVDINADGEDGYAQEYFIQSPLGDWIKHPSLQSAVKEHYGKEEAKEIIARWNRRLEAMRSQKLTAQEIWAIQ